MSIPKTPITTDITDNLNNQIVAFPQTVGGRDGWTVGYRTNYSVEMLEMGYRDNVFSLVFYPGIDMDEAASLAQSWNGQDGYSKNPLTVEF